MGDIKNIKILCFSNKSGKLLANIDYDVCGDNSIFDSESLMKVKLFICDKLPMMKLGDVLKHSIDEFNYIMVAEG